MLYFKMHIKTLFLNTVNMSYYNYHATAKRLIREGRLKKWFIADSYNNISPALVLVFDDIRHPIMPIRQYRWEEYMPLLKGAKLGNDPFG